MGWTKRLKEFIDSIAIERPATRRKSRWRPSEGVSATPSAGGYVPRLLHTARQDDHRARQNGGLDKRAYYNTPSDQRPRFILSDGTARGDETTKWHFAALPKPCRIMEAQGKQFAVRQLDAHLLVRTWDDFLVEPTPDAQCLPYTAATEFAARYEADCCGRCLLFVSEVMHDDQGIYLVFLPSGDGLALSFEPDVAPYAPGWAWRVWPASATTWLPDRVGFRWREHTDLDMLAVPVEQMRPVCERIVREQINSHLRDPYVLDPTVYHDRPAGWLAGSEADLRELTTAICHTEPELWQVGEPVTVVYRARTPVMRAGLLRVTVGQTTGSRPRKRYTSSRLAALCDLALRLNCFEGMRCVPVRAYANRRSHFEVKPARVEVTVNPPGEAERKSALEVLERRLGDRLHKPAKRRWVAP